MQLRWHVGTDGLPSLAVLEPADRLRRGSDAGSQVKA